jgi:hypothetical protein
MQRSDAPPPSDSWSYVMVPPPPLAIMPYNTAAAGDSVVFPVLPLRRPHDDGEEHAGALRVPLHALREPHAALPQRVRRHGKGPLVVRARAGPRDVWALKSHVCAGTTKSSASCAMEPWRAGPATACRCSPVVQRPVSFP